MSRQLRSRTIQRTVNARTQSTTRPTEQVFDTQPSFSAKMASQEPMEKQLQEMTPERRNNMFRLMTETEKPVKRAHLDKEVVKIRGELESRFEKLNSQMADLDIFPNVKSALESTKKGNTNVV